ncbi:hypothetical protein H477_5286 [[Clostridium] sordellii ATCC 9714]|nr:hypothetical protein H477_5286 [[Clostridium] sordellii ATCC 9714] [Paeniclostridium sordellii ATCC 9714]
MKNQNTYMRYNLYMINQLIAVKIGGKIYGKLHYFRVFWI